MSRSRFTRLAAAAALGALVLTGAAAGGAAAAADGNSAPYEKSCVGIVTSFMASEVGQTPAEAVGQYETWPSVQAYQELQRTCRDGIGQG